jgi:hypothetical protein
VKIEFTDGSLLAVGENCDVALERQATSAERGFFSLVLGIVRMSLQAGSNGQEIQTRTAIISVRSTDWIVEATKDSTAVFVVQGEVAVRSISTGQTVVLPAAFGTDVPAGAPPTPPKRWGDKRVQDVLARTQVTGG